MQPEDQSNWPRSSDVMFCWNRSEERKKKPNKVAALVNGFAIVALQEDGCEVHQRWPDSSFMYHEVSLLNINNVSLTRMYGVAENQSDLLVPGPWPWLKQCWWRKPSVGVCQSSYWLCHRQQKKNPEASGAAPSVRRADWCESCHCCCGQNTAR